MFLRTSKTLANDSSKRLACYLLGITPEAELQRSPFWGQLFEGFVAAEILKNQVNQGGRKELYYFRDQQGLEASTDCSTREVASGVEAIELKPFVANLTAGH